MVWVRGMLGPQGREHRFREGRRCPGHSRGVMDCTAGHGPNREFASQRRHTDPSARPLWGVPSTDGDRWGRRRSDPLLFTGLSRVGSGGGGGGGSGSARGGGAGEGAGEGAERRRRRLGPAGGAGGAGRGAAAGGLGAAAAGPAGPPPQGPPQEGPGQGLLRAQAGSHRRHERPRMLRDPWR